MNRLLLFLLSIIVLACKKDTSEQTVHSIILKCWGNNTNTVLYSFGEGDVTFTGKIVSTWTIVRDVKVGKVLKLRETAHTPQPKAVSVMISDNGSQVAYAQGDTSAYVTYTVR